MRQWRILVIKNYSVFERNYKMGNFQVKHFCLDADSYLKFTFISCGEDTEHNLLNYYYFLKAPMLYDLISKNMSICFSSLFILPAL